MCIILASSSSDRLKLLSKIFVKPDLVIHPSIDETPLKNELPRMLALRLSKAKALKVANMNTNDYSQYNSESIKKRLNNQSIESYYIIAADTVSAVGRRILDKTITQDDVRNCLEVYSGKRLKVYTGVCIIKKNKENFIIRHKVISSILKFKRFAEDEIKFYVNTNEGINKSGGTSINGYAEAFISFMSGSHSNIIGLPLFETRNMLMSLGLQLYDRT